MSILNIKDEIIVGEPKYLITDNGDGTKNISLVNEIIEEGTPINRALFAELDKVYSVYTIPEVEKVMGGNAVVADNTNFFTLPYDLSNLNVNQRVLLETPSTTNTTGVTVNKLNNIPIENILQPNQKYELVYDGEKFVDNTKGKVLYDATLEEVVSQIDLPGIANFLQDSKLYVLMLNSSYNNHIYFGDNYGGSGRQILAIFKCYIENDLKKIRIIWTQGEYSYGSSSNSVASSTSTITGAEYIKVSSSTVTFPIGTRIIIKEVC